MPFCDTCSFQVAKRHWIGHLKSNFHKNKCLGPEIEGVVKIASAFRERIVTYRLLAMKEVEYSLPEFFLSTIRHKLLDLLQLNLNVHVNIKVNFEYYAHFLLLKTNEQQIKSFATKNFVLHRNFNFDSIFESLTIITNKKVEEFQQRDSGWTFLNNLYLEVNVNKYNPLSASGSSFVDLPLLLKKKKACINIKNNDKHCFLWSIVASLYPAKTNRDRVTSYPHFEDVLNTEGLSFPVSFTYIKTFECNNPTISINVYSLNKNKNIVGPIYRSEFKNRRRINLLLLENNGKSHYVLITNLRRLVQKQLTKHHGKLYLCEDCLLFFCSQNTLDSHICSGVATILPNTGTFLHFKNFDRKQDVPYVIYADFETLLKTYSGSDPDPSSSFTIDHQQHIPSAFAYHIVCSFDSSKNLFRSYRGRDCVNKFLECLYEDVKQIYETLSTEVAMRFTEKDSKEFNKATHCHICNHLLFFDRVRDHCHLTGTYRGAAHQYCNLNYRIRKQIPVFFHNLAGYDCHLFIKELAESLGPVRVIPKNKENYVSFTKFLEVSENDFVQIKFVDSFKFLNASLEKLANGLATEDFVNLRNFFPDDTKFKLMSRKGVYPYDHMTDWDSYLEKQLPPKSSFYNSLLDSNITEADYLHASCVWLTFNIKNMGEYTDLYIKTDVLLLTDIFENFRKICKDNYGLDPAFYLTAPSLSFDAMLLKTGVHLELLTDLEIVRLIQKGVRGGICLCSTRHAKANNKYMANYDRDKSDVYLTYLDVNNLYGFSMCQHLPTSEFRLLSEAEMYNLDITQIKDDEEYGFILEVDLLYPEKLHCAHNDYPFCAEKFVPPGGKSDKLIPNLYPKFNYVIHYVHLKTCLKHGLILKKIHRIISFRQSPFLKKYIDLNTDLRKKAITPFQQDLFKLMNNAVFGKTLEDNERRVDVKLVNRWVDENNKTKKHICAEKLIARPNFKNATVFSENLVAIQMKPEKIILDKPIYVGFTVLELSKSHMYDFHYSIIKPFYGDKVQLCYTDTDSFIYKIETNDFYKDLKLNFLTKFDTSNYEPLNKFKIPLLNKKIPGLFKDELGGDILTEFIGLRSKLYCIKTEDKVVKKAKGITKSVIKTISFKDYNEVLLKDKVIRKKNLLFKSIKHEIYTQKVNKIALSSNDDKRIILSDKISTRSWGYGGLP